MKDIVFFELQKAILEKLFPPDWFSKTKQKKHPAYIRWATCNKIINQKGRIIRFPKEKEKLPQIGRMVLDSGILVTLTKRNVQQLKLGPLDVYGDEAVQKKIRSRITNPQHYESIMVELAFGAWHKIRNHDVIPLETEAFPDLKVKIPGVSLPVCVECKHLRSGSKNRLTKEISAANSQLKSVTTPCYGIAVLDVSIPVAAGQTKDDKIPDTLRQIADIVRAALTGRKYRSVGTVLLLWDDYMILGEPPANTTIAFRRRCLRIPHSEAHQIVPEALLLCEGYTITYTLYWRQHTDI